MVYFSNFSEFWSLNERILLYARGKEDGAAVLRYTLNADECDRKKILALCDEEAKDFIEKAKIKPDTVNVYRAAAFELVWKYAPALFAGSDVKGKKEVAVAFYGTDKYTFEIFKALVSTYIEIVRTESGIIGKKIRYFFFADEEDKEILKNLPYFAAERSLRDAKGKPGYYEIPVQLADITVADAHCGEDNVFGDAFVWAVVAGGDAKKAEEVALGLKEKGSSYAVFYAGGKEDGKDGVYSFGRPESCASFYLRILLIALLRDRVYDIAAGFNIGNGLAELYGKWKNAAFHKTKRDSNLYAALALRGILLSVGFDCEEGVINGLSAFDKLYDEGNPRLIKSDGTVYYENAVCAKDSLRTALAVREHLRWNEYMYACGVGPASKEEHVTRDKNELLEEGKHINVTTWKGLEEYRRDEAERRGTDEERTDVQRYDFQLADCASQMLAAAGYSVTERRR